MSCKLSCSRKMFSGFKQTIALLAAKQVYQILLHNLKNLRVAVVNEKNFFFFSSQFSINMFWPIFFISLSCKSKFEIIKSKWKIPVLSFLFDQDHVRLGRVAQWVKVFDSKWKVCSSNPNWLSLALWPNPKAPNDLRVKTVLKKSWTSGGWGYLFVKDPNFPWGNYIADWIISWFNWELTHQFDKTMLMKLKGP